jgi:hypothetical protein
MQPGNRRGHVVVYYYIAGDGKVYWSDNYAAHPRASWRRPRPISQPAETRSERDTRLSVAPIDSQTLSRR